MTARIVTVAQQKGGAGKTTLAVQIATTARAQGKRVCLVDVDPQASLSRWYEERQRRGEAGDDLTVVKTGGWRLAVELGRLARDVDLVVVDTPPHADSELRTAIREAALVLVPCQPSALDVWASGATLELCRAEDRPARIVLTRVPSRGRSVEEAQAALAELKAEVLDAALGNRQPFVVAMARGRGAIEQPPKGAAADEAMALGAAVDALLTAPERR